MTSLESAKLRKLIVTFSAPLASVILMIFGNAFFTTFLSVFLSKEGVSQSYIGAVHAAYYLGMFIGAFKMEDLIKRVGHIQALAVFGSVATCSVLVQGLWYNLGVWLVMRFLVGLSLAALYIVIESWMLHFSTIKTRGVVLSLYMISLYFAQASSQQVLSLVDIQSMEPFLVSAIFTSVSVIPVGLSISRIQLPPTHEVMKFSRILKSSPFGVSGCFIAGLLLSALYSFFPILALSQSIPSENLMTITIAGGVCLQWPIGKCSDYFERRKTLLAVVVISLVLCLLSYYALQYPPAVLLTLAFFLGGFLFTLYPLSLTQVCDNLDISHITRATALLLIAYGAGCVIGPLLSSAVVTGLGIHALMIYNVALLIVLTGIGSYTTLSRPIIPLDEQNEFQPLASVTPIAYEMDPRNEN